MDDWFSSTKTESSKKNAVLCPVGEAGVAVAETYLFLDHTNRKFERRDVKTNGELRPKFRSRHNLRASTEFYNNSLSWQVMES